MSAATASLQPSSRPHIARNFSVKAATRIFQGTLLALATTGFVRPAAAANTTDKIVGLAESEADNRDGANGDISINGVFGIYELAYSGTAPTIADVGKPLYVVDDQTVTLDPTGAPPIAGYVYDVSGTSDMVWAELVKNALSPTQVTLTCSNGTAGSAADLTALKAETEKISDDVRAVHAALVAKGILTA